MDALSPLCLPVVPSCGEVHWLSVWKPFHATLEHELWCLYQPPLSYCNGWDDQPDEIAQSALVRCEAAGFHDVRTDNAVVQVRVREVVTFPKIGERFPVGATIGAPLLEQTVPPARRQAVRRGNFSYLSADLEGDVGAWAIIEARQDREYLLVAGEWAWHEDHLFAGNSPLDAVATQALHRMLEMG